MKRLNLDQTWVLCLKMWKWIAKEVKAGKTRDVDGLKKEWLQKHGFRDILAHDCFFCQYSNSRTKDMSCRLCPAKKTAGKEYHCNDPDALFPCFSTHPIAFYKKLLALNKIRLAKKGERNV